MIVMKKYIKFIVFFVVSICFLLWYIFLNHRDLLSTSNNTDYFVANKTWDTDYSKNIFFRKWDDVEYLYIVKNKLDQFLNYNTWDISTKLWLDNVVVVVQNSKSWKNATTVIKIIWKSQKSWENQKDLTELFSWQDKKESDNNKENIEAKNIEHYTWNFSLKLNWNKFYSDIDNLISLDWEGTFDVKSVWVWEKFFNVIWTWNNFFVSIPRKTLLDWKYLVSYLLKNWKIITSDQTIEFDLSDKKVVILEMFPKSIENNASKWITLQWVGLKNTVSVQLSNNTVFKKTDFSIVSDNVLAIKIPMNVDTWTYFVNIMTLDWIYEFPNKTFEIIQKIDN